MIQSKALLTTKSGISDDERTPGGHRFIPSTPDIQNPYRSPMKRKSEARARSSKGVLWIVFALLTGAFFGLGNFFLALISDAGILSTGFLGIGGLLSIFVERTLFCCLSFRKSENKDKKFSRFIDKTTGRLKFKNILVLATNIVLQVGSNVLVTYALYFGGLAKINQGIIPTLFGLSAFFNAVMFYAAFREKISAVMLFGMLFLLASVALISVGAGETSATETSDLNSQKEVREDRTMYTIICLVLACLVPLAFSFQNLLMRKAKDIYPVWLINLDSMFAEYLIEIVILLVYIFVFQEKEIESKYWLFGIIVGVCFYTGRQCIGQAVLKGYAGPAQSLSSTMTIYSTLLTTLVLNQPLKMLEILGLISGILGAVFITGGDFVIYKIRMAQKYR